MIDDEFKIKVASDVSEVKTRIEEMGKQQDERFSQVCGKIDDVNKRIDIRFNYVDKTMLDKSDAEETKRNSKLIYLIIVAVLAGAGKIVYSSFQPVHDSKASTKIERK